MMRHAIAVALLALAVLTPAAAAHVQVEPAQVAPADAVLFTVLVPNERDLATSRVEMEVPEGLVPFAFEEVPGWTRETTSTSDGALRSVIWNGELPAGSFVRFTFLASTPDAPGTLSFRTVQTYADGQEAAWVGPPDSEEPAPTVDVVAAAGRANAGGEVPGDEQVPTAEETSTAEPTAPETTAAPATSAPAEVSTAPAETVAAPAAAEDDDATTVAWIGLVLGTTGLLAGGAALVLALRRRPGGTGGGPDVW